ncbi:T6SS phospholipase effector Tle1-like catalytic domain-containing protein [Pedobacter duraquae]|uniref:Putative alpha/beta hydrolase family protein DUF2235 n=1 Tax=Pedobacter duraquae TaxID=425511 RepID=A0A4R6IFC4_9SPHI|nr:DUF2235 domain-containing protein [Pedobacter duraquae]TDO20714.1 putative alpha/beta hydrolase family protein DUF2235 [Pedobacter duraquae]
MPSIKLKSYTPPANTNTYLDIVVGMFFDGTKNNKDNTDQRNKPTNGSFDKYGKDDDESSYYNDHSNVARLWSLYDKSKCIYVEGIGTVSGKGDDTIGYAFGSGATGIRGKVRKGCKDVVEKLLVPKISVNKRAKLRSITFDVFGFSRGAAAARNFVYEIGKDAYEALIYVNPQSGTMLKTDADGYFTNEKKFPACGELGRNLAAAGIKVTPDMIKVRFLGIFDTVSSYSTSITATPNFNDVAELHLNEIGRAQKVIHFTAQDEHRQNFSLTHTHIGKERNLPGVHSDVGGSYETAREIRYELETSWTLKSNLYPFKKNLIEQNWFTEEELSITGGFAYFALQGDRKKVWKEYSYIPLQFMAEYAEQTKLPLTSAAAEGKYKIDAHPVLGRMKGYLREYVMGNGRPLIYKTTTELNKKIAAAQTAQDKAALQREQEIQKDLRVLRSKYLHWSAKREGIGMDQTKDNKRINY